MAMNRAAASRSSTLEEKLVSAKLPSLSPNPVKSKRRTAIPRAARARLIWRLQVPAAGEAVGEEGVGDGRATFGLLELSGQLLPGGVFKQQFFRHAVLVFRVGTFLGR